MIRCGVVGFPAAHSLSPVIHRAAYAELGLDWSYDAHEVAPGGFLDWFETLDPTWAGLSVTMPHKELAATLGEPDETVALTGVANTIVWNQQGWRTVHNTDVPGLVDALEAGGVPHTPTATILGAGATARSALVAVQRWGVERVSVAARRADRAADLARWAERLGLSVETGQWPPRAEGLLVSTIPSDGAAVFADDLDWESISAVFDVSYDPWPTPLASASQRNGRQIISGLGLLVHQARHQIHLMTGFAVGAEVLWSAARNELLRRQGA